MNKKDKVIGLYKKGMSGHEIARFTGITRSYVYSIIGTLNKIQDYRTSPVNEGGDYRTTSTVNLNVHAQFVRFFITHMNDGYKSHPDRHFKDFIPDVDIQCEGKFIYAWCKKKFEGKDELEAMNISLDFWDHVKRRLEDRLRIVIGGRGKVAFEFLKQEHETRDSELCKDSIKENRDFKVYHNEDGKYRVGIDLSDKEFNHETYHKRDGHTDSIRLNAFINSVLNDPNAPDFAQLVKLVYSTAKNIDSSNDDLKKLTVLTLGTAQTLNTFMESQKTLLSIEIEKNKIKNNSDLQNHSNSQELRSFDYIG